MNLFAQLRYGMYLERKWGTFKYIVVYLISGFGSTVLSCVLAPNATSVGASGAISGLLGAHLVLILLTWNKTNPTLRASNLTQIIFWVLLLILTPIGSRYIDFWGHFGGLVTGAIASLIIFGASYDNKVYGKIFQIGGIAILSIYFIVGFVLIWAVISI